MSATLSRSTTTQSQSIVGTSVTRGRCPAATLTTLTMKVLTTTWRLTLSVMAEGEKDEVCASSFQPFALSLPGSTWSFAAITPSFTTISRSSIKTMTLFITLIPLTSTKESWQVSRYYPLSHRIDSLPMSHVAKIQKSKVDIVRTYMAFFMWFVHSSMAGRNVEPWRISANCFTLWPPASPVSRVRVTLIFCFLLSHNCKDVMKENLPWEIIDMSSHFM